MNIIQKKYYFIIGGLIVLILILLLIINKLPGNLPTTLQPSLITPTETIYPTITPVEINYVVPTMPPELQTELLYPITFENITVEYKSRSGTFLIYFQGDQEIARESVSRFLNDLNINQDLYRFEYRTLDQISLPPRVEVENF